MKPNFSEKEFTMRFGSLRAQFSAALAIGFALSGSYALAQTPKVPLIRIDDQSEYYTAYSQVPATDAVGSASDVTPDASLTPGVAEPSELVPGPNPPFLNALPANTAQPTPTKKAGGKDAKKELAAKVSGAYKDPFYLNDFTYLNNPLYQDWHLGESLKQLSIGDTKLDLGGSYRLRYHHEENFRGLGLTGRDDDFLLDQTRVFANWKINKAVRVYAEFLDAGSSYEDFPSRGIEVSQFDMQNLFADVTVKDDKDGKLTLRGGRQELAFGSQRLVSPLAWGNTRRTFEGARFTYDTKDDLILDGFWTRPVRVRPSDSNSPNLDQQFFGLYAADTSYVNSQVDTYYLGFLNNTTDDQVHTIGRRISGGADSMLWDFEGAYQFGKYGDDTNISAGFTTAGLGHKFKGDWKPVLWAYYDYASGSDTSGKGFNQLFPLGHKYLGFMDLYARRNINDANATFALKPTDRFSTLLWYHYFFLNSNGDGPYTVVNTPFNPGGRNGSRDLGHEIDVIGTYALTTRSEILLGYSHYFTGDYYRTSTNAAGQQLFNGDADFAYSQFTLNF